MHIQFQLLQLANSSTGNCTGGPSDWYSESAIPATSATVCRPPGSFLSGVRTSTGAVTVLMTEHTAAIKGPVVSGAVLITLGGLAVIILGSMAVAKYVQLTRLMRDLSVPAPAHEVDG